MIQHQLDGGLRKVSPEDISAESFLQNAPEDMMEELPVVLSQMKAGETIRGAIALKKKKPIHIVSERTKLRKIIEDMNYMPNCRDNEQPKKAIEVFEQSMDPEVCLCRSIIPILES